MNNITTMNTTIANIDDAVAAIAAIEAVKTASSEAERELRGFVLEVFKASALHILSREKSVLPTTDDLEKLNGLPKNWRSWLLNSHTTATAGAVVRLKDLFNFKVVKSLNATILVVRESFATMPTAEISALVKGLRPIDVKVAKLPPPPEKERLDADRRLRSAVQKLVALGATKAEILNVMAEVCHD